MGSLSVRVKLYSSSSLLDFLTVVGVPDSSLKCRMKLFPYPWLKLLGVVAGPLPEMGCSGLEELVMLPIEIAAADKLAVSSSLCFFVLLRCSSRPLMSDANKHCFKTSVPLSSPSRISIFIDSIIFPL